MNNYTTVVGLDVHKVNIVSAVLQQGTNKVSERATFANEPKNVSSFARRLSRRGELEFVYEAGPCGYALYRQLKKLGHECAVIAPSMTPVRPGDKVKTDRRDAEKLARLYRAGELTLVAVPDVPNEADRDLVRARESMLVNRQRIRQQILKLLLRQGYCYGQGRNWTKAHMRWLCAQKFEQESHTQVFESYMRTLNEVNEHMNVLDLQVETIAQKPEHKTAVKYLTCFKGIDVLSAITLLVEAHDFRRFGKPRSYMSFTGLVPSEESSGDSIYRGSITKAGNTHMRRILVESSWHYANHRNITSVYLAQRRKGCPANVILLATKAQERLHRKYLRLVSRGKSSQKAVVAVARELAGFVWAMSRHFPALAAEG